MRVTYCLCFIHTHKDMDDGPCSVYPLMYVHTESKHGHAQLKVLLAFALTADAWLKFLNRSITVIRIIDSISNTNVVKPKPVRSLD